MEVQLVTDDKAMRAAAEMVGVADEPFLVPAGVLGGCSTCQRPVASHFREGRWVGCLRGTPDMVYILVGTANKAAARRATAPRRRSTDASTVATPVEAVLQKVDGEPTPDERQTRVRRYIYRSALHHKANPDNLTPLPSPTRLKVLKVLHATGKQGLRSKQIIKKSGLPHGSVQQTLNWLRAHQLVKAEEDTQTM